MPQPTSGERGRKAVSPAESPVAQSDESSAQDNAIGASTGGERTRRVRGLANWRVSAKIAAVVAVPTAAALSLAGLRVYDSFATMTVYQHAEQRIELGRKVAAEVDALQRERDAMSAWIASGRPGGRAELDGAISTAERAAETVRGAVKEVVAISDEATSARYQQGLARLDGLSQLRSSAGATDFPSLAAQAGYTGVIDALQLIADEFDADVTDQGLQDRHAALGFLADAKEYSAQQNSYLRSAAIRGKFDPAELKNLTTAQSNLVAAIDRFNAVATPQAQLDYSTSLSGPQVSERFTLQQLALLRAQVNPPLPLAVDPAAVARSSSETLGLISQVQNRLLDDAAAYTEGLIGDQQRNLLITVATILAGLLIVLALMYVVARSLIRPLRTLRTTALQVAEVHLPEAVERIMHDADPAAAAKAIEPVPVDTTEEIGQVARSFEVVHGEAVRLAAEQALLRENVNGIFVNLSRRSQRLVERQLAVIDLLEADEQDPDHLASLFELDHLATRLRRNGESLLVLSGAGLSKSMPKPVSAADVIGAAVSEIEQYARVDVGEIPDVAVRGPSVHDLVHLLAELLDNATYFSEPETKVSVRAVVTRKKALAIQITDRGVGMSSDQVAEANKRLADPPDLDVSVTRRMGLYVVARLAQRHGIEVRLRENEDIDGGVIARVVVPPDLLGPVAREPLPRAGEVSSPSLPPVPAQRTPAHVRRREAAQDQAQPAALPPLDEPISLDDLVAGSSDAAYLSVGKPGTGQPEQPEQFSALTLPRREPQYVPVTEQPVEQPSPADDGIFDDDVPTKRLPIYQSVVSRWFSAEGEDPGSVTGNLDEEPAPATEAAPQAEDKSGDLWHSVSDEGWRAAQSLLESREEEITPAGLPKRVPNAHLVPGSIPAGETGAFTDTTAGTPGQGALARSAEAARERMAAFQRGYVSGRHALREITPGRREQGEPVSGGESAPPDEAVRSEE
ncbi:sensor histidine kinase [Amycolatopsis viridis]|uniref:histidine kinase n=1 Tax=Amycolatopsis viridis TaxID=185678 RepID=A0ABX0SMU3_9PSEU|nr:nitrate- and nitrite sensing domain-containing protein [Amycolatopsis viridis]NIH78289.1 signal transduction histidine kinase [Amycolatopsis viridis]